FDPPLERAIVADIHVLWPDHERDFGSVFGTRVGASQGAQCGLHLAILKDAGHDGTSSEQRGNECGAWLIVKLARWSHLLDAPLPQDGRSISEDKGLLWIVGHVENGETEAVMDSTDLVE